MEESLVYIPGNTIIRADRFSIKNDSNIVALSIDLDLTAFKDVMNFQRQEDKISSTAWVFSLIGRSLEEVFDVDKLMQYKLFVERNYGSYSHPIPVHVNHSQGFNVETLAKEISLAKGEITKELRLLNRLKSSHSKKSGSFFSYRLKDYRLKWRLKYKGLVSGRFSQEHPLYSLLIKTALTSANDSVTIAIKSPIDRKQITEGLKYESRIIVPVSLMIHKGMLRGMNIGIFLEKLAFTIENNASFLTLKRA
jgi:hypothetical protein